MRKIKRNILVRYASKWWWCSNDPRRFDNISTFLWRTFFLFSRWWSISFFDVFLHLCLCAFLGIAFFIPYINIAASFVTIVSLDFLRDKKLQKKCMSERKFMEGTHNRVNSKTHIMWGLLCWKLSLFVLSHRTAFLNKFSDFIIIFYRTQQNFMVSSRKCCFSSKRTNKKL